MLPDRPPTRHLRGLFATSGNKSSSVQLGVTGEGLTGEGTYANVTASYTATAYNAASLSSNGPSVPVNSMAADFQRRGHSGGGKSYLRALTGPTGFSTGGLAAGTKINAGASAQGGSFNPAGSVKCDKSTGELLVNLQHSDQTIIGTSANDLGSFRFNLTNDVNNPGMLGTLFSRISWLVTILVGSVRE